MAFKSLHESLKKTNSAEIGKKQYVSPRPRVGEASPGETRGPLELVKGAILRPRQGPQKKWGKSDVVR